MNQNQISVSITVTALNEALASIDAINTKLPFLLSLTTAERKEMAKMGDKTLAFVTKALEYAQADAANLPPYITLAEFAKDVKAVQDLMKVLRPLQKVAESVEDTAMLAGSEAYQAALAYYNFQKGAMKAGQTGAKTIVQDLSARFPGRPRKADATVKVQE
jgi:hypothetical protein